ncbi:MAG: SUMF1/EgtB/PvdO family nonheme iron enzyme [Nitrospiraceae bacterium]|nr:SUMF1/EgtB/PvdO family nonheme iron enzyme [Nitrospiraceae bacterium]
MTQVPRNILCAAGAMALCLVLCVAGCAPSDALLPPPKVIVATYPESGAEVTVRGIVRGETPVTLDSLPPGENLIVLQKEGFKRAARVIVVPDTGEHRFVFELEHLVGYLTLESKPPGAKIYLDGTEYLGETPLAHRAVTVGTHTYLLRCDNYRDVSNKFEVKPNARLTFAHELKPRRAALSIFSRPTSAKIWLNDEPRPDTTPAKIALPPGVYTVRVHSKGYVMSEQTIQLGANEAREVTMVLKPGDAPSGMILIPAGKFTMGLDGASPDERPQREIDVDAFYIDKNEVTNIEYQAVFPDHKFPKEREHYPATGVSFNRAVLYAQQVGKRLPTEIEWEKAARGTDKREYPWGMNFIPDRCNSAESLTGDVVRVGSLRLGVSPYGCMDMAGNVYEWTSDWYQAYPGNPDITKDYGQIFRVLRGGSYLSDRFKVRCARRHFDRMDAANIDYGLRCAKDIGSPEGTR